MVRWRGVTWSHTLLAHVYTLVHAKAQNQIDMSCVTPRVVDAVPKAKQSIITRVDGEHRSGNMCDEWAMINCSPQHGFTIANETQAWRMSCR
jgi:hypothetical protein